MPWKQKIQKEDGRETAARMPPPKAVKTKNKERARLTAALFLYFLFN